MKTSIISFVSLIMTLTSFAQDKSLLWEVSGNGLTKPSYLYGTMHVSKKIAFRLDDVFYEALDKSECVALESDPTQWLEHSYENLKLQFNNLNNSYGNNFYSSLFELKPLNEVMVSRIIRFDNSLINGYLYRKDFGADNFEEETYLDMFIYQAGTKNGKPIVGLEDIEESRFLATKARYNRRKKKADTWYSKLLKKESAYGLQEDVYRKRNIELLDSIGEATNTPFYRKHMLFERNENMVVVLDTLMHRKSVFAGVGAAHLGGQKGMIQMLKDRGYDVKPLISDQTPIAKFEKEKLENLFTKPDIAYQSTPDGFITIKSFDKLREFTFDKLKYYVAPDMTNGAYLTINRLNTYDFLPNERKKLNLDYIKDLLYEDIPGDIIEQTEFELPYPGISILNRTKKGDYQKYHIYKTPLEIIIVKFGGKKDFVLQYHDEIFDSIQFKATSSQYTDFKDVLSKYSFRFPEYYIADNLKNPGKKVVQGIVGDDYFFFQETPVHDIKYIEEDDFEAQYIHTNFYKELDIKEISGSIKNEAYSSYESSAEIDSLTHRKLWLKSIVKDGSYYLLGYSGMDSKKASDYFKSFKMKSAKYENFKIVTDTSLLFKVNTTTKSPLSFSSYYMRNKKPYDQVTKRSTYTSTANEKVFVSRTKFHDLQMYKNSDSLWNNIDFERKRSDKHRNRKPLHISEEKRYVKNGCDIYTFTHSDSLSHKAILVKYIRKKGVLFKLSSLIDSSVETSKFISEFYDSFTPMDSLLGEDIFTDKTTRFFKALKDNDSIVLKGYSKLKFSKKHSTMIMDLLKNHDFPEDKQQVKTYLVGELITNDESEDTIDFVKRLYTDSYTNPEIQNKILRTLLNKSNKGALALVLELMRTDVPLSSSHSRFGFYFTKRDSLKIMKQLYPNILEFATIEEYKTPVYDLLAKLLDSNLVKPKIYKSYRKQIANDGKVEIKRSLGKPKFSNRKSYTLDTYTKLLFPFRDDQSVSVFYQKLIKSKNIDALTTQYVLNIKANEPISQVLKKETLYNPKAQAILIEKLDEHKLMDDTIYEQIDDETYAKSRILMKNRVIQLKDSITLFEKRKLETDTGKPITLFIFKRHKVVDARTYDYLHVVALETPDTKPYKVAPYYVSRPSGFMKNDITTEDEIIKEIIPLIKHKTRKRVSKNEDEWHYDF